MNIIYIIYNDWSEGQQALLKACGINVDVGYNRLNVEDSPANIEALRLIDDWQIEKFVSTKFNKKDFQKNSLFVFMGVWENGYPMPDGDHGYKKLTYNIDKYCSICGIGKEQQAPFRLKSIPKWNNKKMFELNWIFDELFVRPDLYIDLFKPLGVSSMDVFRYKDDLIIENVVQLEISKTSLSLNLKNHPYVVCKNCGEKKYSPQIKGLFPNFSNGAPELHIFKSKEFFGSGADAHNKVFITRWLWERLLSEEIKPRLWPVEVVD